MCPVDNLQRLIFGNSQSPDNFTGKPKKVSLPTSSQEIVKQKSMFTFTFTLRTIYEVNGPSQYATDNNTILDALLQHQEDNFSKLTVENGSQKICSKQMVDQISSEMIGSDCHP